MTPEERREYKREYQKHYRKLYPERVAAFNKRYRETHSDFVEKQLASVRDWRKRNAARQRALELLSRRRDPQRWNAYQAVRRAVKTGRLKRPECCQLCGLPGGSKGIESHHHKGYDRANRLDVMWLCSTCHMALEGKKHGMAAARP